MKRLILPGVLAISLYACQKTVHLHLDNAAPQIVIQGEVTDDTTGPYTVRVNRSVPFYAENSFPAVSGASIKISDNEGHVDSLVETAPGIYTTQGLKGKAGNTYALSVLSQDTLYTAVSTMPQAVKLDSISFNHEKIFGDKSIYAIPNFQDPPGISNYYQFVEYQNDKLLNKDIFVFDDRLSDGKYISRTLRNDSSYLQPYDWLEVRMYCIDKPVFDYFDQLDQSGGRGGNNTASPANPTSNISNGALGYFSAHTVRSIKLQVY
ncbi:MAG TPA: DUF4249 domain-containing protein [Puia sp.]|nr:DUF4249 domain-containing protein [Puia sp.]